MGVEIAVGVRGGGIGEGWGRELRFVSCRLVWFGLVWFGLVPNRVALLVFVLIRFASTSKL